MVSPQFPALYDGIGTFPVPGVRARKVANMPRIRRERIEIALGRGVASGYSGFSYSPITSSAVMGP